MRKVALVFVLAVVAPSLILAWLALRSLRDQQFLIERQQSLLYQALADAKAKEVQDLLTACQHQFVALTQGILSNRPPGEVAKWFDLELIKQWPLAKVGFAVTMTGDILSPSPHDRAEARTFCADHSRFLANREAVEVYMAARQFANNAIFANQQQQVITPVTQSDPAVDSNRNQLSPKAMARNVFPQQAFNPQNRAQVEENQQVSKMAAAEAEFRQLIGDEPEGALARFVDNKLNLLLWHRPASAPQYVFGAQVALPELVARLDPVFRQLDSGLAHDVRVALLDDNAHPVVLSVPGFVAQWKRPFVATEIGEALPHWEVAVYLANPAKLTQSARTIRLTLGSVIGLLVVAIAVGSWLIVSDLKRQLRLASQKTDFVSNVSHELKTPLTSIRMFSDLLAEGRVADAAKQKSYLAIISAETARLTRLINNVLDFARSERGEKNYKFASCDLAEVVRETAASYRPHLEANGFSFTCELPESLVTVNGDRDALAQVIVNLLSNAEKYSDSSKEITVQVRMRGDDDQTSDNGACAEVVVLDRGLGVPRGCEEKIFEQFYRAHDCISSGIQGSGLGLTLARQIATAHGGSIVYRHRDGGGSCFILRLPLEGPPDGTPTH